MHEYSFKCRTFNIVYLNFQDYWHAYASSDRVGAFYLFRSPPLFLISKFYLAFNDIAKIFCIHKMLAI